MVGQNVIDLWQLLENIKELIDKYPGNSGIFFFLFFFFEHNYGHIYLIGSVAVSRGRTMP